MSGPFFSMVKCKICPRQCGAQRTLNDPGFCGVEENENFFRIGQIMLHPWEEPHIGGGEKSGGVGNIFFSGCSLGCVFCQNIAISQRRSGRQFDQMTLLGEIEKLQKKGAKAIGFVTAEHYVLGLLPLLKELKRRSFPLPLIWNTSSYQKVETLRLLDGFIDIYLTDVKFYDEALSSRFAKAPDYWQVANKALNEMRRQCPKQVFGEDGLLKKGLSLRHLILPGQYKDSLALLSALAFEGWKDYPLALMSQYTPDFYRQNQVKSLDAEAQKSLDSLKRRLTQFEYNKVVNYALDLGFTQLLGQEKTAASADYTPDFWPWENGENAT